MNEAQACLARSLIDVEVAKSKLAEAERALREGKQKALADYNATVDKLEREVERARLTVRTEETYVQEWQHKVDNPFEKRED